MCIVKVGKNVEIVVEVVLRGAARWRVLRRKLWLPGYLEFNKNIRIPPRDEPFDVAHGRSKVWHASTVKWCGEGSSYNCGALMMTTIKFQDTAWSGRSQGLHSRR